jgi:uncharacterized membrane protein YccC
VPEGCITGGRHQGDRGSSTLTGAMAFTPAAALSSPPFVASSSVAFGVIFGIFVAALLVLIVIVVLWALRRDRAGRALWRQRQQEGGAAGSNGARPPRP